MIKRDGSAAIMSRRALMHERRAWEAGRDQLRTALLALVAAQPRCGACASDPRRARTIATHAFRTADSAGVDTPLCDTHADLIRTDVAASGLRVKLVPLPTSAALVMADAALSPPHVAFERAAGDTPCAACGLPYRAHPRDPNITTDDGTGRAYGWLHIGCDGRRWKL